MKYKIIFTDEFKEEMDEIYMYISEKLKEKELANKLLNEIVVRILDLGNFPKVFMKIGKYDKLKNEYHRIVIKNYIVLYTVDYSNQKVFISHIYYKRRNYLYIL